MSDRVVWAAPVVDELSGAEGGLVLVGEAPSRVIRLSAVAVAVRELSAAGMPLGRLAEELAARFGEPADGSSADATRQVVDELVEAGLVIWDEA